MGMSPIPFEVWVYAPTSSRYYEDGHTISMLNKCGIFYCRQGQAELLADGNPYTIKPGDMYIYVTSSLVRLMHRSDDLKGVVVEADIDYVLPIVNKVVSAENLMLLRQHPCVTLTEAQCEHLDFLLRDIENYTNAGAESSGSLSLVRLRVELTKAMGQTLCYEVMHIYFTNRQPIETSLNRKDAIFQNFMLALFRHYRTERSVSFYARKQHLSLRYFSAIVKERTGFSALHWITNMVIADAKRLLENPELSTKEIAYTLNFPSPSCFARYFKLYAGVSPSQYRRDLR
ncbi:MAG: AraC family transcriptional regulator [Prevotellaceae bacterium]|nr:AraC family transcriptional regulator [Prevotellaceae bacterium]